jgi:hypothetical protein
MERIQEDRSTRMNDKRITSRRTACERYTKTTRRAAFLA